MDERVRISIYKLTIGHVRPLLLIEFEENYQMIVYES